MFSFMSSESDNGEVDTTTNKNDRIKKSWSKIIEEKRKDFTPKNGILQQLPPKCPKTIRRIRTRKRTAKTPTKTTTTTTPLPSTTSASLTRADKDNNEFSKKQQDIHQWINASRLSLSSSEAVCISSRNVLQRIDFNCPSPSSRIEEDLSQLEEPKESIYPESPESARISEDPSTQKSLSQLVNSTPIAQWIRLGTTDSHAVQIEEFESPRKTRDRRNRSRSTDRRVSHFTEANSECPDGVGKRRTKRRHLTEQVESILHRYNSSVKMFPRDLQMRNFDEDQAITLIIRSSQRCKDKTMLLTICRDHTNGVDRSIIFKPDHPHEFIPGAILRLYQPWREVAIPGVPLPVMICTDFYKMGRKKDRFGVTEEDVTQLMALPVPYRFDSIKVTPNDEFGTLFENLVPYKIKNRNTIKQQMRLFKQPINLDAVMIQMRAHTNKSKLAVLLRDSDENFCVLEVSHEINQDFIELIQSCDVGHLRLRNIAFISKITIFDDVRWFRILRELGSSQPFYYKLGFLQNTTWEAEVDKGVQMDIPFPTAAVDS